MTYNQKIVTAKLSRIEICDLLIATTSIAMHLEKQGHTATKWKSLHDKLRNILTEFDKKNGMEG